jgi:hypothetical protein
VLPGYPPPGQTPGPTATGNPWPTIESPIRTPLPDEKISVGPITEVAQPKDNFQYDYRVEQDVSKEGFPLFRVFVQHDGNEVRLGDDNGTSEVESVSDSYITWTYRVYGDDAKLPVKSGLYVYVVKTRESVLIASGWNVGLSEIGGDWVLYSSGDGLPNGDKLPLGDIPSQYNMPLIAYHITSGKRISLTNFLPVINGRSPQSHYGVNGTQAGWIEYDPKTTDYKIMLLDLNTGVMRQLGVPLKQPRFLSVSNDMAVWRDTFWQGYSLGEDAVFTIPYAPKDWENVAGFIVTAKDGSLLWSISNTPDGSTRYFEASVSVK